MISSKTAIAMGFFLGTLFSASTASRAGVNTEYEDFRAIHRSDQKEDAVTYAKRKAIFESRKAEVATHNARKESWTLTLNRFADHTPEELQSMMGYKRVGGRWSQASGQSSFLQMGNAGVGHYDQDGNGNYDENGNIDVTNLAKSVDWRSKMNFSNFVHDQGACGSCWAHAAMAGLEAHAELTSGIQSEFATQEIIDCSANPLECGGTGGCRGATAEIAFQQARKIGLVAKDKYQSKNCRTSSASADVLVDGFVRLPENKDSYLLHALATKGPVVMSVDANNLHLYDEGVFSGCQPDTIVNHAVLGVGYGVDESSGKLYWNIKNSWGKSWGEHGYFRVERQNDDSWNCGTDVKPQDGVYCKNHPASITVCGMCGITSDSAYPLMSQPKQATNLRQPSLSSASKVNLLSVF